MAARRIFAAPGDPGKSEIARVADAFNTMADALEHRERELSEAKERAEDAAARIVMIFESTTDSVIIVDRDCRISYLNRRAWAQIAEGRELIGMELPEAFLGANRHFQSPSEAMLDAPGSFEALRPRRGIWYASMRSPPAKASQSSSETSPSTNTPWRRAA